MVNGLQAVYVLMFKDYVLASVVITTALLALLGVVVIWEAWPLVTYARAKMQDAILMVIITRTRKLRLRIAAEEDAAGGLRTKDNLQYIGRPEATYWLGPVRVMFFNEAYAIAHPLEVVQYADASNMAGIPSWKEAEAVHTRLQDEAAMEVRAIKERLDAEDGKKKEKMTKEEQEKTEAQLLLAAMQGYMQEVWPRMAISFEAIERWHSPTTPAGVQQSKRVAIMKEKEKMATKWDAQTYVGIGLCVILVVFGVRFYMDMTGDWRAEEYKKGQAAKCTPCVANAAPAQPTPYPAAPPVVVPLESVA